MSHTHAQSVHETLLSRSTVHDYLPDALPEGAIHRALIAALAAPNHRMTEPWRFVRVGPITRERLCVIQAQLKDKTRSPQDSTLSRARAKLKTPPELIVACRVRHANVAIEREDYAAVACAIENLCLSLWSEGIGSKWSTGAVTTDPETYRVLGVEPEQTEIVGFVMIGYRSKDRLATKPGRKLTLDQVLTELP